MEYQDRYFFYYVPTAKGTGTYFFWHHKVTAVEILKIHGERHMVLSESTALFIYFVDKALLMSIHNICFDG